MKLQVLVSTMHREDYSLLDEMNLQTDAVVINQCDRDSTEEFEHNNHHIKWITVNERGIGKSRNLALKNADADIILFADDDVIYNDGFDKQVVSAFEENENTDIIILNFKSLNENRPEFDITEKIELNRFNCLRYGAIRIAARRQVLADNKLEFSLLFGGGAKYQAGEDNLFLTSCLKAGLKMIAMPINAGAVKQEDSTWFKGYDEKYFRDRGALFKAMFGVTAPIYLLMIELKNNSKYDLPLMKRLSLGFNGIKNYRED